MKKIFLLLLLKVSLQVEAQIPAFTADIKDSNTTKGYFFLQSQGYLMILDRYGNTVYYKHTDYTDNYFKIQSNGLVSCFSGGKFLLMDSTFKVVDSVACKNYETDFHDFMILPNGHFLLLGVENVKMNLSGYEWGGIKGTDTSIISSALIQELDAHRNIVWEWHAKDHYAIDDADTFRYSFTDQWWVHWNSFDLDKDGNILISSRNFNEITKINRKSGAIIWRFGGKRNQFKFINSPVPFYGQRNVKLLPNGHITFLDGGYGINPHGARAMEFQLDEKHKTAILKWSFTYNSSVITRGYGDVQRLSNSNTLIDFGGLPEIPGLCFLIVDLSGKTVFRLNGTNAFRVYQYDTLPFQLHRPQITCFDSAGIKYLDAGPGYSSYLWSTGDTNRVIAIRDNKSCSVFVPYGDGGYISSELFETDIPLQPFGGPNNRKRNNDKSLSK